MSIVAKRSRISAIAELLLHSIVSLTMPPPGPLKIVPSSGELAGPHIIHGSGPTLVVNSNSISIGSAVFVGLTAVTNRQNDRPRYSRSVTIGRIYGRSMATV